MDDPENLVPDSIRVAGALPSLQSKRATTRLAAAAPAVDELASGLGLSDAILKQVDHDNAARLLAARG